MSIKSQTIDQLVKMSTKVASAWIKNPGDAGSAMTKKAILAVCKHLSHEASFRKDIAELICLCQFAAERRDGDKKPTDQNRSAVGGDEAILTARQLEILQLFARGLSYQEVSSQLDVATQTIKNHASAIYDRLGVKNKTEAVFEGRSMGLLI